MIRQWQLHQDAVNRIVIVKVIDQPQHVVLRRRLRQGVLHGVKTTSCGRSALVADVDLAGRIVANYDDGESWLDAMVIQQAGSFLPAPNSRLILDEA